MVKPSKVVYALYRGDEFICVGTLKEIQKETGYTRNLLYRFKCPSYLNQKKSARPRLELVRIEEDER